MLMYMLIFSGRNDEAIEQGQKTLDLDERAAHYYMGLAYEQKRDFQKAMVLLQPPPNLEKDQIPQATATADLAHIYAMAGKKKEALQLLAKLTAMSKQRFVPSWAFAIVYVGLGDRDRAFEYLNKGYDVNERPSSVAGIKVDPRMNPLRNDPRYHELLRRMGLPE
jgi:tetratricopeptide (TPR) repeat protein